MYFYCLGGYICQCENSGHSGTHCEVELNHCGGGPVCQNGGQCLDQPGGYLCECAAGYHGPTCSERNERPEPMPRRISVCQMV